MQHFDKDCGLKAAVVCSNSKDNSFYKEFFPDCYIHNNFLLMCKKVINRQEKILYDNEILKHQGKPPVVLDDVIDNPLMTKNDDFNNILFNGKCYGITLIISIQNVKALPPGMRQQFDYIFLFNSDDNTEITKMYNSFGGMFPSEKIFKTTLQSFTINQQILVLDLTKGSKASLNDKFGVFKSKINLSYDTFGCKTFNEFHQKHYNKNWNKKGCIQVGINSIIITIFMFLLIFISFNFYNNAYKR